MNIQKSFAQKTSTGILYLVATPIGNLDDITVRSLQTLREVDVIACEDTRQTRKLLTHFQIEKRTLSYHEHNKASSGPELINWLLDGKNIALVSDAGLPAISDPGADLVREAIDAGCTVVPIPGANAALTGLIASGLPTEKFVFCGFLPRDKKQRKIELDRLAHYPETILFYEAPHRITKTLAAMQEVLGDRETVLARELTKRYEEFARGTMSELIGWLEQTEIRGEFCIIVSGYNGQPLTEEETEVWWSGFGLKEHVEHYIEQGMSVKEACKRTAEDRKLTRREVYNEYHQD